MRAKLLLSCSTFALALAAFPADAANQTCYDLFNLSCPDEYTGDHDRATEGVDRAPPRPEPPGDDDDTSDDDDDCEKPY